MLAQSAQNYSVLVLATNDQEAKNFASMYSDKVTGLKFKTTTINAFRNKSYLYEFHMVVIVLTKFTTQERLDNATPMLKHYANAPICYCLVNETIADNIKVDPSVMALCLDDKPTRCADLMNPIPSVRALL